MAKPNWCLTCALKQIVGYIEGSVVLCQPSNLGFYDGDCVRFILKRD
jgi:hypothetical protein